MGLYESLNPETGRSRGSVSQIVEGLRSYIENKRANERREEIRKLFEESVQQVRPEVAANAQAVNQMGNIPVDMVTRQRQMQPQGSIGSLPMPSGAVPVNPQTETVTRMRQYTPELAAQAASIMDTSPEQMVNMIFGAQQAEHERNKPMEVGRHGAIVSPGGEELYKNVDPYEGLDYELRKDNARLQRERFDQSKIQHGDLMQLRRDQLASIDKHRQKPETTTISTVHVLPNGQQRIKNYNGSVEEIVRQMNARVRAINASVKSSGHDMRGGGFLGLGGKRDVWNEFTSGQRTIDDMPDELKGLASEYTELMASLVALGGIPAVEGQDSIRVRLKKRVDGMEPGTVGTIDPSEFDPELMEKIP
jgi:hypothetical protein